MALGIRQFDEIVPPVAPVEVEWKYCPRCPSQGRESLHPIYDFGICRARKDGLNLYCKACIREKIFDSRKSLREYRAAVGRPRKYSFKARMRRCPMVDRIRLSLREVGPQTFDELRHSCGARAKSLTEEMSDALAVCMLRTSDPNEKVYSRNGKGPRTYFLLSHREEVAKAIEARRELAAAKGRIEPRSFGVSTVYESGDPDIKGMSPDYLRNE